MRIGRHRAAWKKPGVAAATAEEEYDAYLKTPEGAAALKAYKDATAAVAYKEKPKELTAIILQA